MLAVLLSVDPAFFYPRIQTDQLLYLLKAKALVETGSTTAYDAVNSPPFAYAAMPGVLRAPFMLAYTEFDQQLRGMQVMNAVIVSATAIMSAYVLSWALPPRLHKAAIVFAFAFVLLSPDWVANVFVPLADAPYAMLTLACLILAVGVLTSGRPVTSHRGAIAAFAVLFTIAFLVRFTAPVLFVAIALLARGRWRNAQLSPRARRLVIGLPLVALLLLVVLNAQAIFGKYITEPLYYLVFGSWTGIALNLLGSAIPSQIVPVFNLGFEVTPPTDPLRPVFGTTPRDVAWIALGLLISAVTASGLIRASRRFLPEIACFAVVLPVLGLMVPSTTRYLMSYQPVLWLGFATGVMAVAESWRRRVPARWIGAIAAAAVVAAAAGIFVLRTTRTARTAAGAVAESPVERPLRYAAEVASTFRDLREFIESLPADRTLLISGAGESGRWYVVADRLSYRPDSTMTAIVREKDVYSVFSCGTPMACANFDGRPDLRSSRLRAFGDFGYEKVFERRSGSARAAVFRVTALER